MRNVHMAVPAWCDEPLQLRSRIMALAADKRNFNRRLSARTKRFNMHMFQRCAQATMTAQPELARLYDQLVPSEVTEHGFWANYANRVKLIVSGFYASAGGRKFRQEFESDAEYVRPSRHPRHPRLDHHSVRPRQCAIALRLSFS